jgi:hypothetical protein
MMVFQTRVLRPAVQNHPKTREKQERNINRKYKYEIQDN